VAETDQFPLYPAMSPAGILPGQAQDKVASWLIQGKKIGPGTDLGLPGYRNLKKIADSPHGLAGDSWIAIDKSNVRQYPF